MAGKFLSLDNLKFTLATRTSRYRDRAGDIMNGHTAKTQDMVFKAALDIAHKIMRPMFEPMDRCPPALENGRVIVHEGVRPMLETLGRDGWIAAPFPEQWEGENMPESLVACINFIFASANYSASVYHGLTMGAARLLLSFGSEDLKTKFIPPMLAGRWQGTMALTEPGAGSSLGDLVTAAEPQSDGTYRISGEKIFISAGDHDGVDNVVHLMLARIQGAPAGVKGISLFAVPQLRPEQDGSLVDNDVAVTQVFHKLGYRGAPITGLVMGEKGACTGYLVGQPHHGLSYMFQMMNGARLEVGMGATAIASAAYHAALDYCRTRRQGRTLGGGKQVEQVPIIRHPDVRRMLLLQRAVVEGSLALILQCTMYEDMYHQNPELKDCHLLIELLTPVAKSYPSEMGILATSAAIQCFGGYGYCDDFPVEQHFRDMRIHPIHEGTTGIQAMDLLGRKIVMEKGRAMLLLKQEIQDAVDAARALEMPDDALAQMAGALAAAWGRVETTAMALGAVAAKKGPEACLADAALFLDMFSITVIAWQWLTMATAAAETLSRDKIKKKEQQFCRGKLATARYFYSYELPKTLALAHSLENSGQVTCTMADDWFTD